MSPSSEDEPGSAVLGLPVKPAVSDLPGSVQ